jgi:polysaccharide export outer membrane protein
MALWSLAALLLFAPAGAVRAGDADILVPGDTIKPKAGKDAEDGHVLKPGDRIKVTIYPEDEFIKGGEMQISAEGNITLPLIGKVEVGNILVREAEAKIRDLLNADYLVNPEAVIEVVKSSEQSKIQIVLLGSVRKPGSYEFPVGEVKVTLLKLMSEAGGFSEVANIKKIKIVRTEDGKKTVIRANAEAIMSGDQPDVELMSGDIVHVSESLF